MVIVGESVTVFNKETKKKRVFSAVQWAELGASGQKDWTTKRPAEAGPDEDEGEGEQQEKPKETTEAMIARLVAEGVAKGLAGMSPTPTAMTMTGVVKETDANTPVPAVTDNGTNVQLTGTQTPAEVQAALEKAAADDQSKKTGEDTDPNPELTEARKLYEELYPGQEAGRKQLKTLQEAIELAQAAKK